jgi:hypothetical protein
MYVSCRTCFAMRSRITERVRADEVSRRTKILHLTIRGVPRQNCDLPRNQSLRGVAGFACFLRVKLAFVLPLMRLQSCDRSGSRGTFSA